VHRLAHGHAAGVAGVVDDNQLGAWPGAGELPRGDGRTADIGAAVDQHTGDARQPAGLAEQFVVVKEAAVSEVVRADADEGNLVLAGPGAVLPGIPVALHRDDRVLPGQPLGGGVRTNLGVGVFHEPSVGAQQARDRRLGVGGQPVFGGVDVVAEPRPRLGEEPAGAPVQPVEL
jgi:hypothetical protein